MAACTSWQPSPTRRSCPTASASVTASRSKTPQGRHPPNRFFSISSAAFTPKPVTTTVESVGSRRAAHVPAPPRGFPAPSVVYYIRYLVGHAAQPDRVGGADTIFVTVISPLPMAPSATTTIEKFLRAAPCPIWLFTMSSALYGISGIRMMSPPPAYARAKAIQPA